MTGVCGDLDDAAGFPQALFRVDILKCVCVKGVCAYLYVCVHLCGYERESVLTVCAWSDMAVSHSEGDLG